MTVLQVIRTSACSSHTEVSTVSKRPLTTRCRSSAFRSLATNTWTCVWLNVTVSEKWWITMVSMKMRCFPPSTRFSPTPSKDNNNNNNNLYLLFLILKDFYRQLPPSLHLIYSILHFLLQAVLYLILRLSVIAYWSSLVRFPSCGSDQPDHLTGSALPITPEDSDYIRITRTVDLQFFDLSLSRILSSDEYFRSEYTFKVFRSNIVNLFFADIVVAHRCNAIGFTSTLYEVC